MNALQLPSGLQQVSVSASALVSAIAFALISWIIYQRFLSPLAHIPGPLCARIGVGSWLSKRALEQDLGWKLAAEHDKHGTVVRTGRNTVSICDPSVISDIYRYGSDFCKSSFYTFFAASPGTMMSTLPNDLHSEKRKAQSPAFTMTLLVELEEFVDSCLDDLVGLLDREIAGAAKKDQDKATIELAETLQLLALDVVGELAFGRSFKLCEAGVDNQAFLPMLVSFTFSACLAGTQAWAGPLLLLYSRFKLKARGAGALRERAIECVNERVKQQSSGAEQRKDMLAKLFTAKNRDGSFYSTKQVTVAAGSILGAGSDTTAITMRAVLRYIIGDKEIYDKVIAEIEEAIEEGNLNFPVTYAEGTKLSYFQACLKETLRLHPAVPWTLPRIVPEGGAVLAGHFFPSGVSLTASLTLMAGMLILESLAGTEVAMSPHVVHRRPEAFGEDAAAFRPERWLEADAETKKTMERSLITFGSGSRVCIGKNISLMEITKVVPTLLHKYDFTFTPRSPTSPHTLPGRRVDGVFDDKEPWHVVSQWFAIQSDFWVDVKERVA